MLDQATSNSQTPPGCPTIQLSYDTIYPEAATDPTSKGFSSIRLLPPFQAQVEGQSYTLAVPMTLSLVFRHQSQVQTVTCMTNLLEIRGSHDTIPSLG